MKEYTMDDLIGDVIAGRFERGFAMFDYDKDNNVIGRDAYAKYIPDLIRALNGKRGESIYKADILLLEIMPDEPDAVTVNSLIGKLHYQSHQVVLSKLSPGSKCLRALTLHHFLICLSQEIITGLN